ncbi:YcbK family protein [Falsiroseomonas sp.]|uniref:YcbK family protein n=1 Tax=Falsiroseomonas sp. TaxID=2870721 RepID=UPI0035677943
MAFGRRSILIAAAALGSGRARAAAIAPERFLWMQNAAGEEVAVAFRAGEEYIPAAIARLRHLLRDVHAGVEGPMPPLLLDMLSVLQEGWDYSRPIIVRSGYRTPLSNAAIEGAARRSLHLHGQAVDMAVPGISADELGTRAAGLARRLGFMGVGAYPSFVHLDIGPQRVWTR